MNKDVKQEEIVDILIESARNKRLISYNKIYKLFPENEDKNNIWNIFENACREVANSDVAIYGRV